MDHKTIGGVSVQRNWSQMPIVKAMTNTVNSLLPRPKLDYDVGYDVAVKGASVVVQVLFDYLQLWDLMDNTILQHDIPD
jgi:hypothetical protein